MSNQMTFADIERTAVKTTKREQFLADMEAVVPWKKWLNLIAPFYPDTEGKRGRQSRGLEKMLRMYLLQTWFSLSDEAVEDNIYDSYSMRKFVGVDLLEETAPDAVTLLRFRHLLEDNGLQKQMFDELRKELEKRHYIVKTGTIVDATIIAASSSTKNKRKERDRYYRRRRRNGNGTYKHHHAGEYQRRGNGIKASEKSMRYMATADISECKTRKTRRR